MPAAPAFAAIDFGTSNSAVALPRAEGGVRLVELEAGHPTMPTAVFYRADGTDPLAEPERLYGRAAVAAYVEGIDGRLMRSMKSILGSTLVEQSDRRRRRPCGVKLHRRDRRLPAAPASALAEAEARCVASGSRGDGPAGVLRRRRTRARRRRRRPSLEGAARSVPSACEDVAFQYEPIAAALGPRAHRSSANSCVLVADIGGGTSDFSLVRVGPATAAGAPTGATTSWPTTACTSPAPISTATSSWPAILPRAGLPQPSAPRAPGQAPRRGAQRKVYFDLATWHLINTVYHPARVAELKAMHSFYANAAHHRRLMRTVLERLGHELVGRAEAAKIAVAEGAATRIDLGMVEVGLAVTLNEAEAVEAIESDIDRIVGAALETVRQAGIDASAVDALYFTGGSTGLRLLTDRLAAAFPKARPVRGDRLASVATGLGLHAQRLFAPTAA